jgi:hypothetical protein
MGALDRALIEIRLRALSRIPTLACPRFLVL